MTVREMIDKLESLIAADAHVADLPVIADGCDCTEMALDVRIENDGRGAANRFGATRYLIVAREPA